VPLPISQLNRLGERLAAGTATRDDLRALVEFQKEFLPALEETRSLVETARRAVLGSTYAPPTGRIKQLRSIEDKLRRETTRLTQLQDVVGLRILVPDLAAQDALVGRLLTTAGADGWLPPVDRRNGGPAGYRAVHLIRRSGRYRVEVQVRTTLEHIWAEMVEAADRYYPGLKYGSGDPEAQAGFHDLSRQIAEAELKEAEGDVEARTRLIAEFGIAAFAILVILHLTKRTKA